MDKLGRWLAAVLLATGIAGCGADSVKLYPVTGTVTFDGEPIADGQIIFLSPEEGSTPDAGPIKDGAFSLQVRAGEKRVEIQAMREVPGKMVPDPDPEIGQRPALESYIPERYNSKSELTAEVVPGPKNELTFDLTSEGAE